jgi:ABC-type glycerol-3-phosphate transport system substrate-binding protein
MKKYTFILAFGAMLALTACGSGSTATETTDSTLGGVDTSNTIVNDTTVKGGGGGVMESSVDGKEQVPTTEEVK